MIKQHKREYKSIMIYKFQLKKKYNDEIVYETMLKMGFYYLNFNNYSNKKGLRIEFDENSLVINMDSFSYLSEWLVQNNIMKLPSSLINNIIEENNQYTSFSTLKSNIEKKMVISFIEEFDRIYTSIENEKNSSGNLVQADANTSEKTTEEPSENTDNTADENYLKIALNIKYIKEMFINQIQLSKNKELKSFEDVANTFKEDYIKLEAQNKVKEINDFFDKAANDIENTKDIKDYISKYNKIITKINEDLNNIVKKTVKISSLIYVIDNVTEDDLFEKRNYISKFDIRFI